MEMGQPTWRKLTTVMIPERAASVWTPALDYITAGRLYKITVEMKDDPATPGGKIDQFWTPESGSACTADGDPSLTRNNAGTTDLCALGALIGKVGGSSADIKPDKEKTVLFGVGRHCVFSVAEAAKCGSLYLGINDAQASLARIAGQLEVTIYESL